MVSKHLVYTQSGGEPMGSPPLCQLKTASQNNFLARQDWQATLFIS